MTIVSLIIVALAAYRITRFFVFDTLVGAHLDSGSKFSQALDRWAFTPEGDERGWFRGKVADLLTCPYCLGFWVALATYLLWQEDWDFVRDGIRVFAIAGLAALLSKYDRSDG